MTSQGLVPGWEDRGQAAAPPGSSGDVIDPDAFDSVEELEQLGGPRVALPLNGVDELSMVRIEDCTTLGISCQLGRLEHSCTSCGILAGSFALERLRWRSIQQNVQNLSAAAAHAILGLAADDLSTHVHTAQLLSGARQSSAGMCWSACTIRGYLIAETTKAR